MLVSTIRINGVQSISASLGWLRFGELGGGGGHDGAQQIADCLMWCAGQGSLPSALMGWSRPHACSESQYARLRDARVEKSRSLFRVETLTCAVLPFSGSHVSFSSFPSAAFFFCSDCAFLRSLPRQ